MNKYLEKIAVTRIIKEFAKGNISAPVSELARKGFVRSESTYAQGMQDGTFQLAKKLGVNISQKSGKDGIPLLRSGGAAAHLSPSGKGHIQYSDVMTHDPTKLSGILRHELEETRVMQKMHGDKEVAPRSTVLRQAMSHLKEQGHSDKVIQKSRKAYLDGMKGRAHVTPASFQGLNGSGSHASPEVLARESNFVRTNPYLSGVKADRDRTGESGLVERLTGKRYGVDKMTGRDFNTAHIAAPDSVADRVGQPVKVYHLK